MGCWLFLLRQCPAITSGFPAPFGCRLRGFAVHLTNETYVTLGQLGRYMGGSAKVFRCPKPDKAPGDTFTVAPLYVRNFSMNRGVGYAQANNPPTFTRNISFNKPTDTFVFLEEGLASIDDASWFMSGGPAWGNEKPATYHANSGGLIRAPWQ